MEGRKKKKKQNTYQETVFNFYGQARGQLFRKTALLPGTSKASVHSHNVVSDVTAFGKALNTLWPYYLQRIPEGYQPSENRNGVKKAKTS